MTVLEAQRAECPRARTEAEPARYGLPPGLQLLNADPGAVLLCLRPLLAMRLNRQAAALLRELDRPRSVAELAALVPKLTPAAIAEFLDGLVGRRLLRRSPPVTGIWPRVSIIVPARGRPEATRRCVQSLLALDYPADRREIIVVDDASEPPLALWLVDLPIMLLRQSRNIGQSAARNLAAAAASGTVLAFIDNDCTAEPGWLRSLTPYLDDPAVGIVGGRVIAAPATGAVAAFEDVRSPLGMGPVAADVAPGGVVSYLPTCNLLVRRDLLLAQAGFDGALRVGEDVDFLWRCLRAGARACYIPTGRVLHDHRIHWNDWLRRRADYASSEADLQQRFPEGRRIMHLPAIGLLMLLSLTLTPWTGPLALGSGAAAAILFGVELIEKRRLLQRLGLLLAVRQLAAALAREHAASFYHLSANAARYYSLPLLVVSLVFPGLLPAVVLLLAVAPLTDHYRLRPKLSAVTFTGLYWLELAAYQIGIWRGCWARRTLRPLLPRIRWRK